jgi:hypothetical protein
MMAESFSLVYSNKQEFYLFDKARQTAQWLSCALRSTGAHTQTRVCGCNVRANPHRSMARKVSLTARCELVGCLADGWLLSINSQGTLSHSLSVSRLRINRCAGTTTVQHAAHSL